MGWELYIDCAIVPGRLCEEFISYFVDVSRVECVEGVGASVLLKEGDVRVQITSILRSCGMRCETVMAAKTNSIPREVRIFNDTALVNCSNLNSAPIAIRLSRNLLCTMR